MHHSILTVPVDVRDTFKFKFKVDSEHRPAASDGWWQSSEVWRHHYLTVITDVLKKGAPKSTSLSFLATVRSID